MSFQELIAVIDSLLAIIFSIITLLTYLKKHQVLFRQEPVVNKLKWKNATAR